MRKKNAQKKPVSALLLLTLPTLLVSLAVIALMNWRTPTLVAMELTVDRAVFTVGGAESSPILNTVAFQSITTEKFSRVEFTPRSLEVSDPAAYVLAEDRYPESAWRSLNVVSPVIIRSLDEILQPSLTMQLTGVSTAGILDRIWAKPNAEITVEVECARTMSLTINVANQESSVALSVRDPAYLIVNYARIGGITDLPYQADSLTFRISLPHHSPEIEITGRPDSLVLVLTIVPDLNTQHFSQAGIPITAVSFMRQNSFGDAETAVVTEGEIIYPDFPGIAKVSFRPPDFVGLDRLEKFSIKEITLEPEHNGIRFSLEGVAGHLTVGSSQIARDLRLTLFDKLRQNPRLTVLFTVIAWFLTTSVGGYRLYKDLKGG